jgi:exodeoxyribonuclease V gamma subunit
VLLAKDHLWLFYNGFDVNDGEVREPSSIVQELTTHLAKIVKPSADLSERAIALALPFKQLGIAPQLASLYRIHGLQPFDVTGFTQQPALQRYQDHWYQVAKHIQQPQGTRLPWVNIDYQPPSQDLLLLDSQQWIADITFPARLYLKTLGLKIGMNRHY